MSTINRIKQTVLLVVAVVLFGIAAAIYWQWLEARQAVQQQIKNMELAEAHLPALRRAIAGDRRFRDVTVSVGDAFDGCFVVLANVETEQAMDDLRRLLEATNPPRPIWWLEKLPSDEHPVGWPRPVQ
jgi:hypothetical protein